MEKAKFRLIEKSAEKRRKQRAVFKRRTRKKKEKVEEDSTQDKAKRKNRANRGVSFSDRFGIE